MVTRVFGYNCKQTQVGRQAGKQDARTLGAVGRPSRQRELPLAPALRGADESAVFLTEYGQPQRQKAAIKLISAAATSPELQLSRWRRAAKLPHPHLIRLFQVGRCELDNTSLVFVVMEYAEEDLSQVLPERPLTPAEARAMFKPTLDALAFLHEKGFVHGR